jgi:hypothetical protein
MARFWDMIASSGRFNHLLVLLLAESPFDRFIRLSDGLYQQAGATWKISQRRLFVLLYEVLQDWQLFEPSALLDALQADFDNSGEKGSLDRLLQSSGLSIAGAGSANRRQARVVPAGK